MKFISKQIKMFNYNEPNIEGWMRKKLNLKKKKNHLSKLILMSAQQYESS
jgi:hypothetical protein